MQSNGSLVSLAVAAAGIALMVVLAACVPEAPAPTPDGGGSPQARAACEAKGGVLIIGFTGETCAMPTKDAGKACTSNSQCETFCLAETKSCAPQTPYFGCFATLENGGATPMICVD